MRPATILAFVLLFSGALEAAQTQDAFVLDLRSDLSLKSVFDAGLRPRNLRNLERSLCEVRDVRLDLILPPDTRLSGVFERVEFDVSGDNMIWSISTRSANLNLDTARSLLITFCSMVGVPPPPELDGAVREARRKGSYEPLREIGAVFGRAPRIRIGVIPGDFQPSDPSTKYVRVAVSIEWIERQIRGGVRRKAIELPEGYEHESMEPRPSR